MFFNSAPSPDHHFASFWFYFDNFTSCHKLCYRTNSFLLLWSSTPSYIRSRHWLAQLRNVIPTYSHRNIRDKLTNYFQNKSYLFCCYHTFYREIMTILPFLFHFKRSYYFIRKSALVLADVLYWYGKYLNVWSFFCCSTIITVWSHYYKIINSDTNNAKYCNIIYYRTYCCIRNIEI